MVLAAFVWHWWISVLLVVLAVAVVLALVVGYLVKVERPRFPSKRQGRQRYARQ